VAERAHARVVAEKLDRRRHGYGAGARIDVLHRRQRLERRLERLLESTAGRAQSAEAGDIDRRSRGIVEAGLVHEEDGVRRVAARDVRVREPVEHAVVAQARAARHVGRTRSSHVRRHERKVQVVDGWSVLRAVCVVIAGRERREQARELLAQRRLFLGHARGVIDHEQQIELVDVGHGDLAAHAALAARQQRGRIARVQAAGRLIHRLARLHRYVGTSGSCHGWAASTTRAVRRAGIGLHVGAAGIDQAHFGETAERAQRERTR
jgi:hypothetical protein